MNRAKPFDHPMIFAQIGAWLCVLIGGLFGVITLILLYNKAFFSINDAIFLTTFSLLAFIPFVVFVYPKPKIAKPVTVIVALIELFVVYYLLWNIFVAGD